MTHVATVGKGTSFAGMALTVDESNWLCLLQRHVQEWKQHYKRECQVLEALEEKHQRIRVQASYLTEQERLTLIADQDRQVDELIAWYQLRRERIRERQQQELAEL